jgi:hypothetical protein
MRPRLRYNIIIYYNVRAAPRAASTADAVREIILLCVRRKDSKNFALMVRRTIVWGFLRGYMLDSDCRSAAALRFQTVVSTRWVIQ